LIARGGFSLSHLAHNWDLLAFGAVLGGSLTSVAVLLALRHHHRTLRAVAERIADCRSDPSAFSLADQDGDVQTLLEPLQILCAAYQRLASSRQAEQSRDMERLKESYKDLYHKAPVMFFSLDADGLFVSCNDTLLTTLGYEREDLTGKPYTRLLQPADRKSSVPGCARTAPSSTCSFAPCRSWTSTASSFARGARPRT
jgi:PAS domain-containing protein